MDLKFYKKLDESNCFSIYLLLESIENIGEKDNIVLINKYNDKIIIINDLKYIIAYGLKLMIKKDNMSINQELIDKNESYLKNNKPISFIDWQIKDYYELQYYVLNNTNYNLSISSVENWIYELISKLILEKHKNLNVLFEFTDLIISNKNLVLKEYIKNNFKEEDQELALISFLDPENIEILVLDNTKKDKDDWKTLNTKTFKNKYNKLNTYKFNYISENEYKTILNDINNFKIKNKQLRDLKSKSIFFKSFCYSKEFNTFLFGYDLTLLEDNKDFIIIDKKNIELIQKIMGYNFRSLNILTKNIINKNSQNLLAFS